MFLSFLFTFFWKEFGVEKKAFTANNSEAEVESNYSLSFHYLLVIDLNSFFELTEII